MIWLVYFSALWLVKLLALVCSLAQIQTLSSALSLGWRALFLLQLCELRRAPDASCLESRGAVFGAAAPAQCTVWLGGAAQWRRQASQAARHEEMSKSCALMNALGATPGARLAALWPRPAPPNQSPAQSERAAEHEQSNSAFGSHQTGQLVS